MGHGADSCNRTSKPGFRGRRDGSKWFPAYDWVSYQDAMPKLVERLQGVGIESKDASQLMQELDAKDTLHYVDPPYIAAVRQDRQKKVYAFEMTDAQHEALAEVLHSLKGMVVLSGYKSKLYDRLYKGWAQVSKAVRGEKAVKRVEVLWMNEAVASRQTQLNLGLKGVQQ